jgi:hypothetical protein
MDGDRGFQRQTTWADLLSLVALGGLFAWLSWISWHRWGDLAVDCGKDVYVAMRVADGDVLYRDLTFQYPPLAPYINAWLLRLFGLHLDVLYATGMVSSALLALMCHALGRRALNAPAAAASAGLMLISCAFGFFIFNFILPATYSGLYGFVFGVLTVFCLLRAWETEGVWWARLAGLSAGLALLCKLEAGVAAAAAGAAWCIGHGGGRGWRGVVADARRFGAPVALVVGLSLVWLLRRGILVTALADNIFPIVRIRYWNRQFFHVGPPTVASLRQVVTDCIHLGIGVSLAVVSVGGVFAASFRLLGTQRWVAWATAIVCVAVVVTFTPVRALVLDTGLTGLRWAPAGAAGVALWGAWQLRRDRAVAAARMGLLLGAFTLGLLARWGFQVNIYSRESTAPTLLLIAALIVAGAAAFLLPRVFRRLSPHPARLIAWTVPTLLVVYGYGMSRGTAWQYSQPRDVISTARGEILGRRPHSVVFAQALQRLATTPPDAELLVIPEEGLLNFLSGRRSRIRQSTLIPGMLIDREEQEQFTAQLQADGPQYIIITGRRYREFGLQAFDSYNPIVDSWIRSHYTLLEHLQEGRYRLDIFERPASLGR